MVSTKVLLPDGSEQDANDMICEGCEKSIAEHSCGGSVTISTGPAPVVRSAGRKKDPDDIVPCPHCKGRMHMNLPTGTVNFECFMRQFWTDIGVITDPLLQRLPVWTVDDLEHAVAWSKTLATPITYGKMESAAGGAGTYAAAKPKAPPKEKSERPKKRTAAEKGERIEDFAAEVADENDGMDLGSISETPAKNDTRTRSRKRKAREEVVAPVGTPDGNVDIVVVVDEEPAVDLEAERERKRAERRAILAGSH